MLDDRFFTNDDEKKRQNLAHLLYDAIWARRHTELIVQDVCTFLKADYNDFRDRVYDLVYKYKQTRKHLERTCDELIEITTPKYEYSWTLPHDNS